MSEFRRGRDLSPDEPSLLESEEGRNRGDAVAAGDSSRIQPDRSNEAAHEWRIRAEIARSVQRERAVRIDKAAERGVSREEFEVRESAAAEDGRCAHELEIVRYRARQGPPEYDGTRKVTDNEKQAFWDEQTAKQEKALERFRTEPVEGPDNRPIDPDRHRDFVAGHWRPGDPPFPAGDLDRRDELLYTRRESMEPRPDGGDPPDARPELARTTVPVDEHSRERFPDGVQHDDTGHPDLSRYASKAVRLDNGHGTPEPDARANELFGWDTTPDNTVWHKASDGHTVLLVDADLHRQFDPSARRSSGADEPNADRSELFSDDAQPTGETDGSGDEQTDDDLVAGDGALPVVLAADQTSEADRIVPADSNKLVVGGDAALAGLAFDPSSRHELLGDCFRPGVYDAHNSLDRRSHDEAVDILGTAQRAADLGARVDLGAEYGALTVRWDERDTGTIADADSLREFLDGRNAQSSSPMQVGDGTSVEERPNSWGDAEARRKWFEDWVGDPTNIKEVISGEPWADYQRTHAGGYEVRLVVDDSGRKIWADGLALDPDRVVAVEVKYVAKPGRSMYEGQMPDRMVDRLMGDFDREMARYAHVVRHDANPVERIRLVTNTELAASFLTQRARRILGQEIDLDVQIRREGDI